MLAGKFFFFCHFGVEKKAEWSVFLAHLCKCTVGSYAPLPVCLSVTKIQTRKKLISQKVWKLVHSHQIRGGNYWKILSFLRKSTENIYLSSIIFACPRLCQICELVKIDKISAFPSEKCKFFLPVHHYFYLSRTGGQSVISIPALPILPLTCQSRVGSEHGSCSLARSNLYLHKPLDIALPESSRSLSLLPSLPPSPRLLPPFPHPPSFPSLPLTFQSRVGSEHGSCSLARSNLYLRKPLYLELTAPRES